MFLILWSDRFLWFFVQIDLFYLLNYDGGDLKNIKIYVPDFWSHGSFWLFKLIDLIKKTDLFHFWSWSIENSNQSISLNPSLTAEQIFDQIDLFYLLALAVAIIKSIFLIFWKNGSFQFFNLIWLTNRYFSKFCKLASYIILKTLTIED